ncbi:MAG: rod shape-determining protein RodA [Gammaproteobacteria bacterium]|nr:rod shape-determining protein RodA [Gammaproteobacteria bacterium]MDJ0872704.1 rod shape-determining protein RodA [Gammaproteobacteria bacterium]MDJ0891244.1 rod shape-determining protein RodA [Gammaproteobacteria bacterium]
MQDDRPLAQRLHLDLSLLFGILVLAGVGFVVLYSAGGQDTDLLIRQGVRLLTALAVMFVVAMVPPRHLAYWAPWLYAAGLGLLFAVLFFGDVGKGAQRWLDLGILRFQPSEMVKITVPAMVAWYLAERSLPPRFGDIVVAGLIILVPTILIARQPDLGTALLVAVSGALVLLLAGISWRFVGMVSLLLAAFAPILWYLMHDYQQQRVLTFLNPESDPLGAGYHIIQSKIAIGSGGLYGKGWLNGTQSHLDFLPERSTDFVFAVYSEEFGLLGVLILLGLYLFVITRGLFMAFGAQETFGRLLGGGLTLTFFVYVFVNIGMVTGLLPVVGVPLPLLSYGGTSLVSLMAAFGILMSVHTHRRLLSG